MKKFIIGDCFKDFIEHTEVVSLSQFKKLDPQCPDVLKLNYILGQGISSVDLEKIKLENPSLFNLILNPNVVIKDHKVTHKHKVENCHISSLVKISETDYSMSVMIDPQCSEILDHITGKHINASILIEAARQAFIAITEVFFLNPEDKIFFILKNLESEFISFLYPLTIRMNYKIVTHKKKNSEKQHFEVETHFFHEGNNVATVIRGAFSVYPKNGIKRLERESAQQLVNNLSGYAINETQS